MRLHALLTCGLALTACPAPSAKAPPKTDPAPTPNAKTVAAKPGERAAAATPVKTPKLAVILPNKKFPLEKMLGQPPPAVEALLGEPTGKGMSRTSCVRFQPERVWFECAYAIQRYEDLSGTYAAVQVAYEDGVATELAFEAVPGTGTFDAKAALKFVGVELPGEPRLDAPATGVQRWSWFNSASRLLVHNLQYRVEVSTMDGDWARSKVTITLNHPLTPAQKAKIKQPANKPADQAPK